MCVHNRRTGNSKARRPFVKKLWKANGCDTATFATDAYTEASKMLSDYEAYLRKEKYGKALKRKAAIKTEIRSPKVGENSEEVIFSGKVDDLANKISDDYTQFGNTKEEKDSIFVLISSITSVDHAKQRTPLEDPDFVTGKNVVGSSQEGGDTKVITRTKTKLPSLTSKGPDRITEAKKIEKLSFKNYNTVSGYMRGGAKNRAWTTYLVKGYAKIVETTCPRGPRITGQRARDARRITGFERIRSRMHRDWIN
ncbi:hypothetical protein PUN28_020838 [Cardiocondyla obscurior]|uniref:Uncharacterized protein n=1 Tax=Cardiocondyla obscurior TaxID=286306 RepID=A0AAW2E7H6_9HYME